MAIVSVPKILRDKLTEQGAEALIGLLDKTGTKSEEAMLDRAEDRFGKQLANADSNWEKRFSQSETKWDRRYAESDAKWEKRSAESDAKWEKRFAQVDTRFSELETKIAESEARVIKWSFIFTFGQFWAIIGALFFLIKR